MLIEDIGVPKLEIGKSGSNFVLAPSDALFHDIETLVRTSARRIEESGERHRLLADSAAYVQHAVMRLQIAEAYKRVEKLIVPKITAADEPQAPRRNQRIALAGEVIEDVEREKNSAPDRQASFELRKSTFCQHRQLQTFTPLELTAKCPGLPSA